MENCLVESARQWRIAASVLIVLSWLPAACGADDYGIQVLTDDQIGSVVEVDADEQFEVRLESNPGTGYGWQVSAMTTTGLVALTSHTYVASDTDLVGAAGTDVFVFTAGQGAGILRLDYFRSFDDPIVPERVAEYIIRIDGAEWPPPHGTNPSTNTAVAPGEG